MSYRPLPLLCLPSAHTLRHSASAALLAGAMITSGCVSDSPEKLLASGQALLAKHDFNGAKLQAKSVLQQQPDSGPARLILGQALLAMGDAAGAEAELQRALNLKEPQAQVLPALARALVQQGKGAQLLQQHGQVALPDPQAQAGLQTQLAAAHAATGQTAEAQAAIGKALAAAPEHAGALMLRARLAASAGDLSGALAQVDALMAKNPKLGEGWLFQAELEKRLHPQEPDRAEAAFKRALAVQPDLVAAHAGLIGSRLLRGDMAGAVPLLGRMAEAAPKHPQTLFLQAAVASQQGDLPRANELVQQLLRNAPENVPLLLLAGEVAQKQGALAQAETHLGRAVQLVPQPAEPRLQLAQVQLRRGQADKVLATLKPLTDANPPHAKALALAAQAQQLLGDATAAEASLAKAAQQKSTDKGVRTTLALANLAKGRSDQALAELESVAASDKGLDADLALISARLRATDQAGALKATDQLAAKMPGHPLPHLLRGQIAQQQGQVDAARKHFDAALAARADFMPALLALAQMDVLAKKPDAAKARFEALLQRQPQHAGAMVALAELNARAGGKPEDTQAWLVKAVKAEPTHAAAQAMLVDQLMAQRQLKPALDAAQAAVVALPDNPDLLDRQGRVQLALGDHQQAVSSFNKLAQLLPRSALPQMRLLEAHARARNEAGQRAALRKAVALAPKDLAVQQAQFQQHLRDGKTEPALVLARAVQAQQPRAAVGWLLEGDVAQQQKRWDQAAAAYRQGLAKPEPGVSALRLHTALLAGGKAEDAERVAADWRQRHPEDQAFVLYLADTALARGQAAEAERLYRELPEAERAQVMVVNNLAYALALQKKPGAVALAKQALAIQPDSPLLMDTLAFCLASEGQVPRAVEVQTQAVGVAPDDGQLRLQLARLHLQAGDKPGARAQLTRLSKLGPAFPRQEEVAALLKSAGG